MSNTELINKLKLYGVSFSEIEKKEIDNYLTNFRKTIYNQALQDILIVTNTHNSNVDKGNSNGILEDSFILKLKK